MAIRDLSKVEFGLSSAEDEATEHPNLLIEGYFPYFPEDEYVFDGKEYLIIGYKGSGKSTIAHRTSISYANKYNRFVTILDISDLPINSLGTVFDESDDRNVKFRQAWDWLLLLQLFDSWYQDRLIQCTHPSAWSNTTTELARQGLVRDFDINNIAYKTIDYSFKAKLSELAGSLEISQSMNSDGTMYGIVKYLKDLCHLLHTNSKHIIFVDGLDDADYESGDMPSIVASLISSIRSINRILRSSGTKSKLVFLCRTDILDSVSRKNVNKSLQDFSYELDWYHDPRKSYDSRLIKLIDKRVSKSLGEGISISDLIPNKVNNVSSLRFATRLTRHLPRDITRLFHYIQSHSGKIATEESMLSGFRSYSKKYLQREVRDELGDYLDPDLVTLVFNSIAAVGRQRFHPAILKREISRHKKISDDLYWEVLRKLFDCGAIGNIEDRRNGDVYRYFKYRNRDRNVSPGKDIIVHDGLFKAFDLI